MIAAGIPRLSEVFFRLAILGVFGVDLGLMFSSSIYPGWALGSPADGAGGV